MRHPNKGRLQERRDSLRRSNPTRRGPIVSVKRTRSGSTLRSQKRTASFHGPRKPLRIRGTRQRRPGVRSGTRALSRNPLSKRGTRKRRPGVRFGTRALSRNPLGKRGTRKRRPGVRFGTRALSRNPLSKRGTRKRRPGVRFGTRALSRNPLGKRGTRKRRPGVRFGTRALSRNPLGKRGTRKRRPGVRFGTRALSRNPLGKRGTRKPSPLHPEGAHPSSGVVETGTHADKTEGDSRKGAPPSRRGVETSDVDHTIHTMGNRWRSRVAALLRSKGDLHIRNRVVRLSGPSWGSSSWWWRSSS